MYSYSYIILWEILNHRIPTTVIFTRTGSGHGKVVWHIAKPLIISRMLQSWETHLDNNAHRRQSEITHHIKACVIHARGSQQSSAEQTQWYWSCHNNLCNRCGGWGIIINLSPSSTGYTELIVTCILNSKILQIHPPRIPYIYVRNFLKLTWAGKLT